MWRFPALRYRVGRDLRTFGDHWVSISLKGVMRAPLYVHVVLLCSAYRAFSCGLLFQGSFRCDFLPIVSVVRSAITLSSSSYVVRILSLAVVGLVGVLCGERTFLDLTIMGFLF